MPRLARSVSHAQSTYDAVVVGSGYGGGVAASRLARIGLRVAVLERGREILPGEFPDTLLGANKELRLSGHGAQIGPRDGLFDLRLGSDVHTLVGCGLGGTSLINANVCLAPDSLVLEDEAWPEDIRVDHRLNIGYHRARAMLRPDSLPADSRPLKLTALEKAAQAFNRHAERVPVHIAFSERTNEAGVLQPACTQCGDCMGGCNVGAKTTVHSTYLTDAVNHGAELFTGANVRLVERVGDLWRIVYHRLEDDARAVPVGAVTAAIVVLAAGTLGSTEILMRSRDRGLRLSDQLGHRFSTNADVIAFGYNNDLPVNAVGIGGVAKPKVPPPGPGVCGLIDLRRRRDPLDRLAVVEASVQSALASLLGLMVPAAPVLGRDDTDKGLRDLLAEARRVGESVVSGVYAGAIHNTQVLLAVGHDAAAGELVLKGDEIKVHWPDAIREPVYAHVAAALRKAVAATGGTYVPNPVGNRFLGGNLFTVHPLGGCAMGRDRTNGVVDHRCRVFDGAPNAAPDAVHEGLYVCDGAVIPRPLGVHPLLTITAVAERAMLLFARDHGLTLDAAPKAGVPRRDFRTAPAKAPRAGLKERIAASLSRVAKAS